MEKKTNFEKKLKVRNFRIADLFTALSKNNDRENIGHDANIILGVFCGQLV